MSSEILEEMSDAKPAEETLQCDLVIADVYTLQETPAVGVPTYKEDIDTETANMKMEINDEQSTSKCPSNILDEECINPECPKKQKPFMQATIFALSYFKVTRRKYRPQFICVDCFDQALGVYEECASIICRKQPLKLKPVNKWHDFEEIESSDEEKATNELIQSPMENPYFSKKDLELIDKNWENSMKRVFNNSDIRNQLTWEKTLLSQALKKHDNKIEQSEQELREIEKMADNIQESLGSFLTVKTLDINDGSHINQILPADILLHEYYYGAKYKDITNWIPCQVVEFVKSLSGTDEGVRNYKIKFFITQYQMIEIVTAKQLAYLHPPKAKLTVGTRVIALFDGSTLARGSKKVVEQNAFYPGIIAEPLAQANKCRYLVFYDDGYSQYVHQEDVRLVCQASDNVWEDVNPASRDFIKEYIEQYSDNRPMVQKNEYVLTESNGAWMYARAIDIDCSLVLLKFIGLKNYKEWVYRGSLRFNKYLEHLKTKEIACCARVPKESKEWENHECNVGCLVNSRLNWFGPLAKPLFSGWEREELCLVEYRAPCGKSLRNIEEVRRYLRFTENVLNVDNFDFNPDIRCVVEYKTDHAKVECKDISNGQEKIDISLINYYDDTLPPPFIYTTQRIPTEGVFLNLDEEFLSGCDCEDDCSDKSKCSCWQLTIEGVRYCKPRKPIKTIGYQYKRLNKYVRTGIYECNSRCKCKWNCLNRVVQHPLQINLKVFKTKNRGWGLLCSNDIPKGTFICVYIGHLLTDTKANKCGIESGDEYFAELDFIEMAEELKEGYESDVEHSESEEDEDTTFSPNHKDVNKFRHTKSQMNEEDSQERPVISYNPNANQKNKTLRKNSVLQMFGECEAPYVIDAKTTGNLSRFLNHSCNPNLFSQNVFVDTHDPRFPWIALFASHNIQSGTELTWNYNYVVGEVAGKVLYCKCGAANCHKRLI